MSNNNFLKYFCRVTLHLTSWMRSSWIPNMSSKRSKKNRKWNWISWDLRYCIHSFSICILYTNFWNITSHCLFHFKTNCVYEVLWSFSSFRAFTAGFCTYIITQNFDSVLIYANLKFQQVIRQSCCLRWFVIV